MTGQDATWLLRVVAGKLVLSDRGTTNLVWPEGDPSPTQIWKLTLSVVCVNLNEWNPQVQIQWDGGSKFLISPL